jgi:OOP family OmpA-OmpF porin
VIRLRGVEFEFDSDKLTGASSVVLDAAAEGLRGCPKIQVRVEGHTDSIGSDEYNQGLGLRRANAVKGYMAGAGIAPSRLTARSFGESRPIASNETDEGRALNRRVELHTE